MEQVRRTIKAVFRAEQTLGVRNWGASPQQLFLWDTRMREPQLGSREQEGWDAPAQTVGKEREKQREILCRSFRK